MRQPNRPTSAARSYLLAARIGVGIGFIAPVLWFAARYWWTYHTTDGMVAALAHAALAGTASAIEYALTNPVESLLYSCAIYLLWAFAFDRHRHRCK